VLPRAGMATVALLVAAWLALSLHNAVLTDRTAVLTLSAGPRDTPQVRRRYALQALEHARSARLLNPDRAPDTYAALAVWLLGRRAESLRQLDALARAQPDDAFVWLSVLTVARGADPAREARARARVAVLHRPPPGQ